MGYSHHWTQIRSGEDFEWQPICKDFRKMMVIALLSSPLPIQRERDNDGPPSISDHEISFSGIGRNGCETMVLQRFGRGFQFCKTLQLPYDRVVTALFILAEYHAPGVWLIHSGDPSDWQEGLELARTVRPDCVLPPGVPQRIMGYSHNWTQIRPAEIFEWQPICKDFRKMIMVYALLRGVPLRIQRDEDDDRPPTISDDEIYFNGIGEESHEPMVFRRSGSGDHFCKTQHKPYDGVVTALLILAEYHAPGVWVVQGGDPSEWQYGWALARTVQPDCVLPPVPQGHGGDVGHETSSMSGFQPYILKSSLAGAGGAQPHPGDVPAKGEQQGVRPEGIGEVSGQFQKENFSLDPAGSTGSSDPWRVLEPNPDVAAPLRVILTSDHSVAKEMKSPCCPNYGNPFMKSR
ncbi:hypothetical protein PAPYR_6895 [Paratrimastix pyriformis]|uniref:Uncharacterized protein n=1 Tax=Paratrimastix pyriformis TaxID=342808 RepID=A0ABQ8UK28_9EUKA|nr:hypothetical protein PAPYR_6895 [Paratrimastix pyriformis]